MDTNIKTLKWSAAILDYWLLSAFIALNSAKHREGQSLCSQGLTLSKDFLVSVLQL